MNLKNDVGLWNRRSNCVKLYLLYQNSYRWSLPFDWLIKIESRFLGDAHHRLVTQIIN